MSAPADNLPSLTYDAADYDGLRAEISDVFMGETGDLIREHARAVMALRRFNAVHAGYDEAQARYDDLVARLRIAVEHVDSAMVRRIAGQVAKVTDPESVAVRVLRVVADVIA